MRATTLFLLLTLVTSAISAATTSVNHRAIRHVIIDTDAGTDDLMAIAFLLRRPELQIDGITVSNGLAHVPAGAENILRLLTLAGRSDVPVFMGRTSPLRGTAAFPAAWRQLCDDLPGVSLPRSRRSPEKRAASDFLAGRMSSRPPVEVLVLGPLTNIAEALARTPEAARRVKTMIVMGGALHVPGNLRPGYPEENDTAEFNIFVDPEAAREVFASGAPLVLVPLDATNATPIDQHFIEAVTASAATPLGRSVVQILGTLRKFVASGTYFAWDPVTAAVLADPSIATTRQGRLAVTTAGTDRGRTTFEAGSTKTRVATSIDSLAFRRMFLQSVSANERSLPAGSK